MNKAAGCVVHLVCVRGGCLCRLSPWKHVYGPPFLSHPLFAAPIYVAPQMTRATTTAITTATAPSASTSHPLPGDTNKNPNKPRSKRRCDTPESVRSHLLHFPFIPPRSHDRLHNAQHKPREKRGHVCLCVCLCLRLCLYAWACVKDIVR